MAKVLITLDFDGVISPIDHDRNFVKSEGFDRFKIGGFDCAIAFDTIEAIQKLKDLAASNPELIEVIWGSSWEDLTQDFPSESGGAIPEMGYLTLNLSKSAAISDYALHTNAETVIVLEDSERVQEQLAEIWKKPDFDGRELVSVQPQLEIGLTAEHFQLVWETIQNAAGNDLTVNTEETG